MKWRFALNADVGWASRRCRRSSSSFTVLRPALRSNRSASARSRESSGAVPSSGDGPRSEPLWRARDHAFWADKMFRQAHAIPTDVRAPVRGSAECVTETKRDIEREPGSVAPIEGYAGDGASIACAGDDGRRRGSRRRPRVHRAPRRAGPTDGWDLHRRHGIGQGKMRFLEVNMARPSLMPCQRSSCIDPVGIMNPGQSCRDCLLAFRSVKGPHRAGSNLYGTAGRRCGLTRRACGASVGAALQTGRASRVRSGN